MKKEEYLIEHIPHRINLLLTFRERFSQMPIEIRENYRDIIRCSKDISILMARFLLGELGLRLGKRETKISYYNNKEWKERIGMFNIIPLHISKLENDIQMYNDVFEVLIVANRAVAHIESEYVNHNIKDINNEIL